MDFDTIRRFLDEAERVVVPEEPPSAYGEPVRPDETEVGHSSLQVRKLYTLAQIKADIAVECARLYDAREDTDGSGLAMAHERTLEIDCLEVLAEMFMMVDSIRVTGGEGEVNPRAGWRVAWTPPPDDGDDEA